VGSPMILLLIVTLAFFCKLETMSCLAGDGNITVAWSFCLVLRSVQSRKDHFDYIL